MIFAENESNRLFQRSKIYLVLDGEVSLVAGKKVLGSVKQGEIFGEMAAITHAPRSATAVAKIDSTVIALDDEELERALEKTPGFALMLMSMLIARLRDTIAKLIAAGKLTPGGRSEGIGRVRPQAARRPGARPGERPADLLPAGPADHQRGARRRC